MALPDNINLYLVNSIDDAWEMKRWLGQRREVLGVDTETTGLNPYAPDAKLRMIQIGDHNSGWAVPWEQWGGVALECLNQYQGTYAVHNLAFDEKWLRIHAGWQIPWGRVHDTMIHYNMLYPGKNASLKDVCTLHIDRQAFAGQAALEATMKKNGWNWATIPIDNPAFASYSALDPVLTAHAWSFLRADLKYPKSFDLEMSVLRICSQMEDRGVPVDLEYTIKLRNDLDAYVEKSKKWAQDAFGISISSNIQLGKYIENVLGAPIVKRTPTGVASVDLETMEGFMLSDDPRVANLAKFVVDVRRADKMRGSYFENFINSQTDGLLHPSIKTMRAVTGRMSVTNPAVQTLHKDNKAVRNAIVPHEGNVLISSDLDQVEFRIFAHLSEDQGLISTFLRADETGSDAFTEIGANIYNDPNFSKEDPRRRLVKNVIYGRLYGSGIAKMAATAGVPEEQMRSVSNALDVSYPGIKSYQKANERAISNRLSVEGLAYITTLTTGRKIPVEEDLIYKGLNYTIQSSAAEIFKTNLVRLDAAGLGEFMMLPVHDEILMSVPKEDAEDLKVVLQECMTTTEGWSVPLTSGAEGPFTRWGTKS